MLSAFHLTIDSVGRKAFKRFDSVNIDNHGLAASEKAAVIVVCHKRIKASVYLKDVVACVGKNFVVHGLKVQKLTDLY